jgi:hypothetical protein
MKGLKIMNEIFNAEEATKALKEAATQIEASCAAFNKERERVTGQLSQTGTAMGGNLGKVALQTFEAENETSFANLKQKMNTFMTRAETITKRSTSAEQTTTGIYSQRV